MWSSQKYGLLGRPQAACNSMQVPKHKTIRTAENVELLANTEVQELVGEDHLEGVVVEDNRSGTRRTMGTRALFVFIGAEANTGWLQGAVELDERGFVLTGRELDGFPLEGNVWQQLRGNRTPWRPACLVYSRLVMCAAARSSEWPPPWARALWR